MKHLILIAAVCCAACTAFAGPGDEGLGLGGFMDDLFTPYDDTAVDLPGENTKKPAVSRSEQLVDDSDFEAWQAREAQKQAERQAKIEAEKEAEKQRAEEAAKARAAAASQSNDEAMSRWNVTDPETGETNFNPFKNDYRYKGGNKPTDGSRPEFEETRGKIKEILGDGVPKTMTDAKLGEMLHNPAREATQLAPTTPPRWIQAPNGWFCDYDDAMAKAETSGRAVAVFFHSSNNDESRRFKTERMENNRFKTRMRGRLLVVYLDYPNSNNNNPYSDKDSDHDRDKRNKDQIEHNRRIAEKFNVNTYPTVVFLSSSGGEIGRMSGAKSLNGFLDEVEKYVPEKDTTVKNPTGFKIGGSIGMGESRVTLPSD